MSTPMFRSASSSSCPRDVYKRQISVFAQSDFDKYFEKKSLRVDFALSGNLKSQSAAIQGLREEPVWGGPVKNLIDKFNYGGYYTVSYTHLLTGK